MKQQNNGWVWWLVIIIVLIGGLFYLHSRQLKKEAAMVPTTTDAPDVLPGISTTVAPWPVELSRLKARLSADGLPALSAEGSALHIHQHLDIFVHGKTVPVPAGIGINEAAAFISPIHVHDTSGIIHVESPTVQTFTLGQFFDIWGVRFTASCIGSYCVNDTDSLRVYVNGVLYQGDPRALALDTHQVIAIVFGTSAEIPAAIPSTYTFPAGY